jgi:hypothetical protein
MHPVYMIEPALFPVCVRHHLRAVQPLVHAITRCGDCGRQVDNRALHYMLCRGGSRSGNCFSSIHDALAQVLRDMLRSVYPRRSILVEDVVGATMYSPNHRPDITVMDHDSRGVHLLCDVSIVRPCSDTHADRASSNPGGAAAYVESQKLAIFGDVGPHRVVPLVFEEYGHMGPSTAKFFSDCVQLRVDRLDVESSLATWSASSWSSHWRQRISVALVRRIADTIIRRAQGDYSVQ